MSTYPVRQFMDLSPAHVTEETRDFLENAAIEDWPTIGGKTQYGWFLYCQEEPYACVDLPDDLKTVFKYARSNDCEYVLFDCDCAVNDALPTYDWED